MSGLIVSSHTRADRRRAVCDAMRAEGIARLVVASTGLHMIDVPNPFFHLTGFRSVGPALALLDLNGTMRVLVSPRDDAARARAHVGGATEAVDELARGLWAFFEDGAPVASAGVGALPFRLAAAIEAEAGAQPRDFDAAFARATARKTDDEIAAAVTATAIAERGYEMLKQWARPGVRECDLAVRLNLFMKEEGADDSFLMLNCAPRADAVMPSSERPLEAGDLILVELSPSVEGQFVQICRTVSLGPASRETVESYDLLVAALQRGIARVVPGARMGDACAAIDDFLSEKGFAQFSRPPFIKRRGHGLGAGSVYPGDVAVDNDTRLEEGMVFIVHPNQFLPVTGYMMCGEPLVVGRDGPIVLSKRGARLDDIAL